MPEKRDIPERTGYFVVRRDSYEVLCLDQGSRNLFPGMQVGQPCYRGVGKEAPCLTCPMGKLEEEEVATFYQEEVGMDVTCFRMEGAFPAALVSYRELSPDERQTWMENGRYQAILRQNRTIAFEYDPLTGAQYVSPFISQFLSGNYDGRLLSQVMVEDGVLHPQDKEKMLLFRDMMQSLEGSESAFMRLKTIDGEYRWFRMAVSSYFDEQLDHTVLMGTITDSDEEVQLRERQRRLAEYDESTGIFHKTAFFRAAEEMARRHPQRRYAMVVLDIDRFKLVNDLFGMQEGDRLLGFLSRQIVSIVRPEEPYGRIRDDLFGMCLARSDREIMNALEHLTQALEQYPLAYRISISVGVCRFPVEETPMNILCDRAMLALKTVKSSAVRWVAFYEAGLSVSVREEQELIDDMRRGMEEGQFEAWFQPKNDLRTGRIVGGEALVRWQHPHRGLLTPAAFLPVFERNGLITRLDENVWEQTARWLRRWVDLGLDPPPMSVNVSRIHLYDPHLAEKLRALLRRYGLAPRLLEIELTESAYVENPRLAELMNQLRGEGFTFLMDDFGSGYSSLNMLRSIPVDILKLDLHFLGGEEKAGQIITESVIQMARRLEIPVIAEGVETEEDAAFLRRAGCEIGQGYLYAKPMPAKEFEQMLWQGQHIEL